MRFQGFDLNLLVALNSLLKTRSVSETARVLNVTQPAISIALRKLRDQFQDEILVPQGNVMIPTAFAEGIAEEVAKTLVTLRGMIEKTNPFDPAKAERNFVIQASDFVIETVMVDALRRLEAEAPGIRVKVLPPVQESWLPLEQGEVDLSILPKQLLGPDHPTQFLMREKMVLIGCRGNSLLKRFLTEKDLESANFVAAFFRGSTRARSGFGGLMTAKRVTESTIVVANFASIPTLLLGTDRVSIVPQSLARRFRDHFPLQIKPVPGDTIHIEEHLQYHRTRQNDAGLQWLVAKFIEQATASAS